MKLKEQEKIVGEYSFINKQVARYRFFFINRGKQDLGIRSILTNKRVIFISKDGEEHYPLSKITSVSIEKTLKRSNIYSIVIFALILYLIPLAINFTSGIEIGLKGNIAYYIIISIIIFIEYRPKKTLMKLKINHMGGNKTYISEESSSLHEFIEKINETLM